MKLKQKTINGLFWSFTDNFAKLGIQFIVGIILARILSPREFGLIGMLTIFIAVSQSFVNSGFGMALIRKKSCSDTDYSTVFFFNMVAAVVIYFILFQFSGAISIFFEEPQLEALLKVLGLGIILNAFSIIQNTILTRAINFKVQTYITLIAAVGSGVVGISLALLNFGVWSLVALTLSQFLLNALFLWYWSSWRPILVFSKRSFKELFAFGSKLMLSNLIGTIYQNLYFLVIGKYFSAQDLGFFTRASQFRDLPSKNITNVIQRVSYPVLASIQDDIPRLKENYTKLIRSTMFISFNLMIGMAVVAKPMVITLVGEKWLPSVVYLQLLSFVGMSYPLQALNLNILNVKGRSDLYLKIEIIKKIFAIPVFFVAIYWGIKAMIIGLIILSAIAFTINSFWSGKLIGYSTKQQLLDILPSFLLAVSVNSLVYLFGLVLPFPPWGLLLAQISTGIVLVILLGEMFRLRDYKYLKEIFQEQWNLFFEKKLPVEKDKS